MATGHRFWVLLCAVVFFGTLWASLLRGQTQRKDNASTSSAEPTKAVGSKGSLLTEIRTLTDNGGRVSWSKANNRIAFSRKGEDGYFDVYVMKSDGSDQTCLTCNKPGVPQLNDGQPEWYPSGEYMVFQAQDPDLSLPFFLRSKEKYLTQGGSGINNNLWIASSNGGSFHRLTHIKSGEACLHPQFSHDGKRLLWTARISKGLFQGGYWALKIADFVMDDKGLRLENEKNYRPRAEKRTFYESHGFSPDDKKIIFSASIGYESPTNLDIWTMDLSTGELTNLTHSPGVWDEHAHYAPQGDKIVWISSQGYPYSLSGLRWRQTLRTEFWIMDADGANKQRLTFFNDPASPEYTGRRTICADSSWNREGDKLVGLITLVSDGKVQMRDSVLTFASPQ